MSYDQSTIDDACALLSACASSRYMDPNFLGTASSHVGTWWGEHMGVSEEAQQLAYDSFMLMPPVSHTVLNWKEYAMAEAALKTGWLPGQPVPEDFFVHCG
jgi:hypothetical protein